MKREKVSLALSTKIFSVGVPQPRQLPLRENEITSLFGLKELTQLKEINLRTNQIVQINEFDNLSSATQ